MRIPRSWMNSARPLKRGEERLFDQRGGAGDAGRLLRFFQHRAPVAQLAAIALHHAVPVQSGDLVEQLGAEAVHHAHHHDQRGDTQHHGDKTEPGDDGDERLAPPGQQIAAGDHPFVT
jgi:hypothetical protein